MKGYFFFLVTIVILLACKKDKDVSLTGKWKLDSIQVQFSNNGQPTFVTMYKSAQDYYDYRTDGKLYRFYNNHHDTLSYETISMDGSLYIKYGGIVTDSIKQLDQHSMLLMNPQGGRSKLFFTR